VTAGTSAVAQPTGDGGERFDKLGRALRELGEPVALRLKLRGIAAVDAPDAQREAVRLLSAYLWRHWRPLLAEHGVLVGPTRGSSVASPRGLRALLGGDVREVWLWVMGDRPFPLLLDGITGRFLRRLAG
jgi:hypothetical protein